MQDETLRQKLVVPEVETGRSVRIQEGEGRGDGGLQCLLQAIPDSRGVTSLSQ